MKASKGNIGIHQETGSAKSIEAIKRTFKPEFINRLDAIVEFNTLPKDMLIQVVKKFVTQLGEQLKSKNIDFSVSDEAIDWLFEKGHQPQYGARPFERTVDEHLKKPLVDDILFGKLSKGGTLRVNLKNNQLEFLSTPG